MNNEPERPDPLERNLPNLLNVSKPDVFWARQKNAILLKIQKPEEAVRPLSKTITWAVVPFFAGFLGVVGVFKMVPVPAPDVSSRPAIGDIPPAQDWALLEQLEMMEHLENLRNHKA